MINVLLVGIGISISVLCFQGFGDMSSAARIFNEVTPYLLNNCIVVSTNAPKPYFSSILLKTFLDLHFSNLNGSIGVADYSYRVTLTDYQMSRRYPMGCTVQFSYRSVIGRFDMRRSFVIEEGSHA